MRDRSEPTPTAATAVPAAWRERAWVGAWLQARTARAQTQTRTGTAPDRRLPPRETPPATGVALLP